MIALRTLVDKTFLIRYPIAHSIFEVGITQMSQQQLSALECSLAQRTILSTSCHFKLFGHSHVITVRSAHLLIENFDDHLMRYSPMSNHGYLISKVLATQWTLERRSLRQFSCKPIHKMFVCYVSHQNLRIGSDSVTTLHWT